MLPNLPYSFGDQYTNVVYYAPIRRGEGREIVSFLHEKLGGIVKSHKGNERIEFIGKCNWAFYESNNAKKKPWFIAQRRAKALDSPNEEINWLIANYVGALKKPDDDNQEQKKGQQFDNIYKGKQ